MSTRLSRGHAASVTAIVASVTTFASAVTADTSPNTSSLQHSIVLEGLDDPWDMAFLPDGTMLFTEKCQGLSVRLADGTVNALLGMTDSAGYPATADDLFCEGQAGMNGVTFDPDFADNRQIYVFSTSRLSLPPTNRVMRMTLSDDFTTVSDRIDIVDDIPYKEFATDHPFGGPGAHNGGRLRFNPADGFLYVTTGDTHNGEVPQSPTLLGGKVLRIDADGAAAENNNPPPSNAPRINTN